MRSETIVFERPVEHYCEAKEQIFEAKFLYAFSLLISLNGQLF